MRDCYFEVCVSQKPMSMRRFLALCLALFAPLFYVAAQGPVPFNGLVVDANGNGIGHISVMVKGTRKITITDHDGKFGLTDVAPDAVLVLSMGNGAIEVSVSGRKSLKVMLIDSNSANAEASSAIEQQGSDYVQRRELNSGREVILGDDLRNSSADTFIEALVECSSSLALTNNGLTLIENVSLQDSKPMIMVNGYEVESFDLVNMSDVDVITIYKDEGECTACGFKGVIDVKIKNEL